MRFFPAVLVACLANLASLDEGGPGRVAHAAELPAQVDISYSLARGGAVIGTVSETFVRSGRNYTIRSTAAADGTLALIGKGAIRRESRGIVTERGLRPLQFLEQRGHKTPTIATFDWEALQLILQREGRQEQLPLTEPAHDRLSVLYSFAFRPLKGNDIAVSITDGRRLTRYKFVLAGKERLDTGLGNIETLHLVREHEPGDKDTEVWLAPTHFLLPVRIIVTENDGTVWDQVAIDIRYQPGTE